MYKQIAIVMGISRHQYSSINVIRWKLVTLYWLLKSTVDLLGMSTCVNRPVKNMNRAIINAYLCILSMLPTAVLADEIFVFAGHTYKIVTSPATWSAASTNAKKMRVGEHNGYLVRIDSKGENDAVFDALISHLSESQLASTIANDGSEAPFIWLGGSDIAQEGEWVWENNDDQFWSGDFNGSAVAGRYTNWGIQPDSASGPEDALAMGLADWPEPFYDLGAAGQWNDLDVGNKLVYVVEFDGKPDLRLSIEEPVLGRVHSGVGLIRGWAVSSNPIEQVEVFINDEYQFDIPYGGKRSDVGNLFSDIPNAVNSGYATAVNFSALGKGEHELRIRVTDAFGSVIERTVDFEVTRFNRSFIRREDNVELGWSRLTGMGERISIRGALIDGHYYDIELQWQTASQGFEIVYIESK